MNGLCAGEPRRVVQIDGTRIEEYEHAIRIVTPSDDVGSDTLCIEKSDAGDVGAALRRVGGGVW